MNRGPLRRQGRAALYPGLELATVLDVEPAELLERDHAGVRASVQDDGIITERARETPVGA